jgi:WD40 repeat protein
MPRTQCLTPEELAAFHLGDLPETDLLEMGAHLECCPRCEEAARALDSLSDPTLAAYRQSAMAGHLPGKEALPERVGNYEILEEIGRGGMGVVYKARHVQLQRVVALKMLLASYFADRDQRLRFRAEAEAVARLQHPHIVQLFEIGEHEAEAGLPCPYFTLEFVEGGNLAERLAGQLPPPRQAAAWLEPLARAVHYAHQQGIIHRDLKPSNILLTRDGQPKICDFGVAKLVAGSGLKTLSGVLVGTAEYMAPEQAGGRPAAEPATDVYALGAILYELLTGRPPFKGISTLDTLNQVKEQEPVPPRRLQPRVPRDLETIALKCLAKEPRQRYATAAALAEDLHCFSAGKPIAARPVSGWEQAAKWCRRRPGQAALAAALVAVTVLGLAGVVWQLLRAEAAKEVAIRERDAAQWQTYRANIAAATSALQLGNFNAAQNYLEAPAAKYRNWEWRHLFSRLDSSQLVLRGHEDAVEYVAFSPDGTGLASASASDSEGGTVRLWDVGTGKALAVLPGHGPIRFSPDGKYLAFSSTDGTVQLWEVATRRAGVILRGDAGPHLCHGFSPDGRRIATRAKDWTGHLWDTTTGMHLVALRPRASPLCAVVFSPNGKQLAGGSPDGTVCVWDAATGDIHAAWQAHSTGVERVAFSPDGTRLVSSAGYPDHVLRLWDVATGRPIAALTGHKNQATCLAFSPDGSRILSASWDQTARLWDAATGKAVATLQGHRGQVLEAAFRPGGAHLVTASEDQTLRLWDATTGELVAVLGGHLGPVHGVAFSPDGSRIASASADKTIRLWDVEHAERNGVLRGHTAYAYDVAFSPDGARMASAAWDGTVRIWDITAGRQTGLLKHEETIVTSVAFSPDGKLLVSVVRGNRVYLWDLITGKARYVWQAPDAWMTDGRAVFNSKGTVVAAAAGAASVHLWDVSSGEAVAVLGAGRGSSGDVAFSPDGTQVISAERDGILRLWDVATGAPGGVLRGHTGEVLSAVYSPDGRLIASAGRDKTVRLWDVKAAAELAILPHASVVYGVAFSPDGTRLAAACRDNTIRLWDVATREEVAELRGHADYVHAVAFSPDGTRLASCSGDFTVRVWDTLPPQVRVKAGKNDGGQRGQLNDMGTSRLTLEAN